MSVPKEDREAISRIMLELHFQTKTRGELDQLMTVIGFQDDVAFAKSLFTQKIAQIYKDCNSEYEKFLSGQVLVTLPKGSREFLLALFRKYHEYKISPKQSQTCQQDHSKCLQGLKLPNPNNIEEVISFQKKMYKLFKNLMPDGTTLNQTIQPVNLISNPSKFTPFPIFPDRSFRSFENQYFPQMGYVPAFGQRCSSYQQFKKRSSQNSFNRSQSFFQRPSFFSKNNFSQFQKASYREEPPAENDEEKFKGFTTFGNADPEMDHMNPGKKIKRDTCNLNFTPQNIQTMRKELQQLNRARNAEPSQPQEDKGSLEEKKEEQNEQ